MTTDIRQRIEELAAQYPQRASALMPALMLAQCSDNNVLTTERIRQVAEQLGVPPSHAYGVATYYSMYNVRHPVGKFHIQVDTSVPAMLAGADEILARLKELLGIDVGQRSTDGLFSLAEVEDLGSAGTCPVVRVNDVYYERMTLEKTDALVLSLRKGVMPPRENHQVFGGEIAVLLKNRGNPAARTLDGYRASGGYVALAKARTMTPEQIVEIVKYAIVRGRGGAGFPAGMKWGFLAKGTSQPVYLICNADEGEPGTFKDRQIMEYDPHLLLEGIAIAARAVRAAKAFIYIRGEFSWIADIVQTAIDEAKAAGLLEVEVTIHRGAGSYVCGEETALIESLEGKRGCPRPKPPFPASIGLYGCPTVVNNVETLACLPFVIEKGADEFKKLGVTGNAGPKLFGVSGHVNKPGVYEFEFGTPLMEILRAAGGVQGRLKAVIVGGLSVPILTAHEAEEVKMDYDSCLRAGTTLGSGGVIVINDTVSIPRVAHRAMRFYAHESCGQCAPCRQGSVALLRLLDDVVAGRGRRSDIQLILDTCESIIGATLCPTGDAYAVPLRAMITKFRPEFEAMVAP